MKINEIHHIGINTRDLKKSIRFYTEVLKLHCINEADLGEDYAVYIECGPDSFLELFCMDGRLTEQELNDTAVGVRHIAFDVDQIEAWDDHLKRSKIPYRVKLTKIEAIHKRVLLVEAPDNIIIELCQNYENAQEAEYESNNR